MSKLIEPKQTIEVLQKYGLSLKKRFGQNFLIDKRVLDRIIAAAELTEDDAVLEIGPGIGTLTQALADRAGHVTAVEIDKTLMPVLEAELAGYDNIEIVNDDILKYDVKALSERIGGALKVVANLPYYITTPIIMELLEKELPIESITVMVQKEVAERMAAGPGTKDYGALSLAVRYYSLPELVANVPPNCFIPRPNVSSVVIKLRVRDKKPVEPKDKRFMFQVIKAAFAQRRKTLQNSLANALLEVSKTDVSGALVRMGLDESVRGEVLTLEQFAELSDLLREK